MRPRFSTFLDQGTPVQPLKHKPFVVGDITLSNSAFDVSHRYAAGEYLETNAGRTAASDTKRPEIPAVPLPTQDELREANVEELNRHRRQFALANHPDMLPERERNDATERMATINRLIDDEIARRQSNEPS